MPELRQNRVTKEWVVMATERARRPEQLRVVREKKQLPHYSFTCPFCPGNEHMAPPEVWRTSGEKGEWLVRVVPNKFAALSREGEPTWDIRNFYRTINAVGIHDVMVETPDHALTTALLDDDQVVRVLQCYLERFDAVTADPRVVHITIFKNHGAGAGTSLEHPHSQLIGTPVVSSHVRYRLHEAMRHYDEYGTCVFCDILQDELKDGARIVEASDHFVALEPFESASPFSTYIYPRRHMASFGEISATELNDLATVLRSVLAKLYWGLEDPDFNYSIRTAPKENAGVNYYHWYVSIIPRLTRVAGFELGSGMFINTVLPEAAAEFLRKVNVADAVAAAANK
ncbi:MAG: galactose-1-phosphate uridylyltransferase [Acidobacteria bacterium]|nr:galactose-1-phosphate uridylyltransferase [Acidobacteriota bacterium]